MNCLLYLLSTNWREFLHGRVMIVEVRIDWQRHCGQFEH
jgi:hypothetical protein